MILTIIDMDEERRSIIILVISPTNLERMRKADPISVISVNEGGWLPVPKYPTVSFIVGYEEDQKALQEFVDGHKSTAELLHYLRRGYHFSADLGDGKTGWKA